MHASTPGHTINTCGQANVLATGTHENAEAAFKAATSGSLVLWKLTLPSSSHFDKDVVEEEKLQNTGQQLNL